MENGKEEKERKEKEKEEGDPLILITIKCCCRVLGNIRTEVASTNSIHLLLPYLWIYIITQFKMIKPCTGFFSISIGHLSL